MKFRSKILLLIGTTPLFTLVGLSTKCVKKEKEQNTKLIEKLGLKIADTAINQTNTNVEEFVKDIKSAKTWDEALNVLKKYNIKYDLSNMPKKAKYEISASTHGHDDDGIIHLDITRTIDSESKTERFEIAGFKKNPIPSQVTIGNYKINTKIKNSDLTIADVIKQLKEAQTKGFEELIKKLNELVGIEKINKNNSSSNFEFNFEKIHKLSDAGQIHFEEIFLYNKENPNNKTKLDFEYKMWNLKKE